VITNPPVRPESPSTLALNATLDSLTEDAEQHVQDGQRLLMAQLNDKDNVVMGGEGAHNKRDHSESAETDRMQLRDHERAQGDGNEKKESRPKRRPRK
jgi:hypothetical protein